MAPPPRRAVAARLRAVPLLALALAAFARSARAESDFSTVLQADDPLDPYDDPPTAVQAWGATDEAALVADPAMDAERSLVDYDAVNGLDQEDEEVVAEREMASTQAKRCGPGSKMSVPVYYIAEKTAHKRRAARFERHFQRAVKTVRVDAFEALDPKKANVIWTFASLGKIPVSSTVADPDTSLPIHRRKGRLASIGNAVSHLRAVAAAYDAGEKYAVVMEDDQPDDFERDWPGSTLHDYIEALPDDWKIVNLGAHFPEVDDEYDFGFETDPETGERVAAPVSVGERNVMANWIRDWNAAGRPAALPRPYRVSPDPRLAAIRSGVAAHDGGVWLLNREGMRAILDAYRREDGSFHLDAATCTEYDTCVVGEAFRDVGGFYESTPPLFVQKPGNGQLEKFHTGPEINVVLHRFRAFVAEWLEFVNGKDNGFLNKGTYGFPGRSRAEHEKEKQKKKSEKAEKAEKAEKKKTRAEKSRKATRSEKKRDERGAHDAASLGQDAAVQVNADVAAAIAQAVAVAQSAVANTRVDQPQPATVVPAAATAAPATAVTAVPAAATAVPAVPATAVPATAVPAAVTAVPAAVDTASGSLGLRESSSAATSATSASSAAAGAADFDDGVDKAAQSRLESSIIAAVDSAANAEKATAGVTDDDTGTLGKTEYGYVEEVKPDAATTAAMSVRQKAEEEVKRQLEETATRAAAKSRGVDWKAMVNVDDGEEPFYGVYEKPKKKQDPKYITKPGEEPYYASIDEAEEALVAKQGLARAAAEEKARAKREKRRARRERKRREREIEESADYFDDDGGGDSGNGDDALEPEYDSDGFECERPSTLGYSDRMKRRSGAARLGSAPRDDFEFAFFRELRDGDLAARGLAALGAAPEAAGGAAGIRRLSPLAGGGASVAAAAAIAGVVAIVARRREGASEGDEERRPLVDAVDRV